MTTQPTEKSVAEFLDEIPDPRRQADARVVCDLMQRVTGEVPVMWGPSIVGFGGRHLRYASGRETDWMLVGFAPRKAATTVYLTDGFEKRDQLLSRLGPHSVGTSCLYLKRLDAIDLQVLEQLVSDSVTRQRS